MKINASCHFNKMQVALVCNSTFGTDGISMFVLNNHRNYKHENVRYHLIYSSIHVPERIVDGYLRDFEKEGDKAVLIPKENGLMTYAFNLYRYLRSEKIEVLHVHGSSSAVLLELVVATIAGVKKTISHSHNTRGNHVHIHKILRPLVPLFADKLLACGENAGRWMYGKKKNFIIIPNSVQTSQFKFDEAIRQKMRDVLGLADDDLVIGHVGTFTDVKNQLFLLKILKALKNIKEDKHYKLVLIGHGPLFDHVKNESVKMGLADNVLFLGIRSDISQLMMMMDVFCLPSKYEGFPIVAVEAQAAGLPFLYSSTISGEINLTNLTKSLPIDKGVDVWAKAIMHMTNQHHDRNKYADLIRNKGYDIECSARRMEALYY